MKIFREVTLNSEHLSIAAISGPEAGGATSRYLIYADPSQPMTPLPITFQSQPVSEGVNGVTMEALLTVVLDRLAGFQSGPFACSENERAMNYIGLALSELNKRTKDRVQRGVEGQLKP